MQHREVAAHATEKEATVELHQMVLSSGKETFATADQTISHARRAGVSDVTARTSARRDALHALKICAAIDTRSRVTTMEEGTVAARVLAWS